MAPRAVFAFLVVLAACGASAAEVERGFTTFSAAGPLLPPDKIFVPSRLDKRMPLVVVLHGCEQDADAIAASARWNALAEREGFLVLYPNQQLGRNPYNCWNWFAPLNQTAGVGEPAEIVAAIEAARTFYPVDPDRVSVVGISAGAATAAVLLSCYPGVFAAGAVHSGVAYAVATNAFDALDVMKNGPAGRGRSGFCDPSAFAGGVMIVHGSSDAVINPANAERLAEDFAGRGAARAQTSVAPGAGGAYGYRTIDFSGGRADVREVLVEGLGHAWSGGAAGPAGDPRGPDATGMMWSFFSGRTRK